MTAGPSRHEIVVISSDDDGEEDFDFDTDVYFDGEEHHSLPDDEFDYEQALRTLEEGYDFANPVGSGAPTNGPRHRLAFREGLRASSQEVVTIEDDSLSPTLIQPETTSSSIRRLLSASDKEELVEKECLAKILDVFPDISHDHIQGLFEEHKKRYFSFRRLPEERDSYNPAPFLIEEIIEARTYPKQKDVKRKRPVSTDSNQGENMRWEVADDASKAPVYTENA